MEDREVGSEIGIASDGIIPVFPGAIAQFLLIVLAPDFTRVKITGQRLLERVLTSDCMTFEQVVQVYCAML